MCPAIRLAINVRKHREVALLQRHQFSANDIARAESVREHGGQQNVSGANGDTYRSSCLEACQRRFQANRAAFELAGHGSERHVRGDYARIEDVLKTCRLGDRFLPRRL